MKANFNIDKAKSYATEKGLDNAVLNFFGDVKYLVVCNRQGRFTAVFNHSANMPEITPVNFALHGFIVI